jgi:hypothetical protein
MLISRWCGWVSAASALPCKRQVGVKNDVSWILPQGLVLVGALILFALAFPFIISYKTSF